jgi:transposase
MDRVTELGQLEGMPEPYRLWRCRQEGELVVGYGPRLLFRCDERDGAMRNLAAVALVDAGAKGSEVAELLGVSREHVSRLRARVADGGSQALLPARGAPRKLSEAREHRALKLSEAGVSGAEIARRMGVSEATISRALTRRRAGEGVQASLELGGAGGGQTAGGQTRECQATNPEANASRAEHGAQPPAPQPETQAPAGVPEAQAPAGVPEAQPRPLASAGQEIVPVARLGEVTVESRYAGGMLLYPFLDRLGVDRVLGSLAVGETRRYDAPALILSACFSFALGSGSLEQTKHLVPTDAGALLGLQALPSLRTLRPRLAALAEASDPLLIQRQFARAMLQADERPPELFYVDDHFVTYWGAQPVAKGYNIRRHLAEPGRDDTFVVDDRWRAVCFDSGEPRGLSVTLPGVLGHLKEIVGQRTVMIGFDRGGSYPKVFSAIAQAGMQWITWRRAPLVQTTATPRRSWVTAGAKRRTYLLADERIELEGYQHGPVRQLSAYEHDKVVFQVLTSNHQLKGAPLVHRLKGRWCIENTNKYLENHHGIHWLCTYQMDTQPNTAKVANPDRKAAREQVKAAEAALDQAKRALGQAAHARQTDLDQLTEEINSAQATLEQARQRLKPIPAKLPATQLDPNAQRATPLLARRSLQMVCRLLAYNAELDLARRLNLYLADPDEYRTIARHLLHLAGTITYQRRQIKVTLDRPHPPRVARALELLIDELNNDPPHFPADHRSITYRLND